MRAVPCVGLVIGCLALAGCSHFGKKTPTTAAGPNGPPDPSSPFAPSNPPVAAAPASTGNGNGILAGQVLGGFGSQPPLTYIQVKLAPEANQAAGAPIDVEASKDGYFTIQGLQAGKHYQLIARAKDGEHSLAGTVWATPPNPRLVIRLSENFQRADTPPIPPPPIWPGPSPSGATAPQAAATTPSTAGNPPPPSWPTNPPADPSWVPVPRPTYNPYGNNPASTPPAGTGIGTPVPKPPDLNNIADQGRRADNRPAGPTIDINGPGGPPQAWPSSQPAVPTVVPSCVLTGTQLVNFALNDLAGQPWEYRNHRSRLTLIDFWETRCMPCQRAMPHLNILQQKYGTYGLTVVGIAYEEGTQQQQVQKVERVRGRLRVSYTMLLGGDANGRACPVRTQFVVRAYPTLVLIDETGRVLWRSEGLQKQQLAELETILRQRLLAP